MAPAARLTVDTTNSDRNSAVHLLQHYLKTIALKAGMKWERDLDVEVEAIVDHILLAAQAAVRSEHKAAVDELIQEMRGEPLKAGERDARD